MTEETTSSQSGSSPVVVVTGASAGIGRATAIAFASRGSTVALLARGQAGLEGARRDVEAAGGRALVVRLDVADAEAVSAAADCIASDCGRIDIWVNNAMATVFGPADHIPADEWRRVTEVTYLGAVFGTLAALRHMRARRRGAIVQVSSALAYRSIPLQAPYCASKAALRGFTDSLRCELLHDETDIKLSMVHLPGVNTPQFDWSRTHMPHRHRPVGAICQPEIAAAAIVQAAMEAPRDLWVGVPAMQAILGSSVAPGLLDSYLARTTYDAQSSDVQAGNGRGILFAPADGDGGVHGRFDDEARLSALRLNAGAVRSGIAVGAAVAMAGMYMLGRGVGRAKSS
jgi:NAD(P)-dependent dehydrogenase (short-subunit alcohol dehydrogenase family)